MDIGHSRLLKFLTTDKPNMEKHTLKIENLTPSDIESEVPRLQNLREATTDPTSKIEPVQNVSDGKLTLKQGDTVETYAPVITVKTVEANFGKDGMRFQRTTVTEDISVAFQHLFKKEVKPGKTVVTQIQSQPLSGYLSLCRDAIPTARAAHLPASAPQLLCASTFVPPLVGYVGPAVSVSETNSMRLKGAPSSSHSDSYRRREAQIEWVDLRDMVKKPIYMGLHEEVIKTQHIRPPRPGDTPEDVNEKTFPGENKLPTRIPVSRFKPAAERALKEKKHANTNGIESKKEPPEKPRRTSIPKLKEKETPKTKLRRAVREKIPVLSKNQYKITKKDDKSEKLENIERIPDQTPVDINHEEPVKTNPIEQLEDEFDKLYEEIVDVDGSLPSEILEPKIKDPEKLESTFAEIVHQYDEEPIEQVKLEPVDKARYSKIPLLRRRSSHDVKVPRQLERTLSLKTGITNLPVPVNDMESNYSKTNKMEEVEQSVVAVDNIDQLNEDPANKEASEKNNDEENKADLHMIQTPHRLPDYTTIATPDAELVKVGIFGKTTRNIPIEETNQTIATPEIETVKVAAINIPAENPPKHIDKDIESLETKPAHVTDKIQDDSQANDEPEIKEIVTLSSLDENYVIDQQYEDKAASKDDEVVNDKVNFVNVRQPRIPIANSDDELKSFTLLRNNNSIEERTKSRYVMKPLNENNSVKVNKEEDLPKVKRNVSGILKRLSSKELPNKDVDVRTAIEKEPTDIQTEPGTTPKRSVLSRIAMFESASSEPLVPKKASHKYSKPIRTISEEIRHSPKIVEEVLKPKDVETNKHTILTVDIMQPVEVVTNNEEQVTIIENLKEKTVIYDNFDDDRRNQIESNENEASNLTIIDRNEIVISENNDNSNNNIVYDLVLEHSLDYAPRESYESFAISDDDKNYKLEPPNNIRQRNNYDKPEKWKSTDALADFMPVKEKINRLTSYEDFKMQKAKSTAELDLGDAVKGKVKKMIVRMSSFEVLDDAKPKETEVISVKERPRKKSVSEKIALFEGKLTPVAMDSVKLNSARALNIDSKPVKDIDVQAPVNVTDDYAARIKELTNAKAEYGSVSNMSFVQMRDGRSMPVLAVGTALIDPKLAKHIVSAAIDLGYRAIDTAFIYGTEREVGEGIRAKIQDGTVRREDLFIMNKLWSTYHRPDLVETACRASLAATGLDYFDLYMIHNPMSLKEGGDPLPKIANVLQFSEHDYLDAWFAMENLITKGLVRSIGVSNFNSVQLARVIEKGRVKPVVNQVECHPYLSQQRLSDFCEARDIRLSCFGVLGSKGTPAELKGSQAAAIDDPLVQVMAAGLGITPAQLLIRYQIDSGHAAVVKASTAAHLWENLQALNVTLQPSQMAGLQALNNNKRTFTFKGMGDTHKNYPFMIPF